jgi:hypothetical protein
MFYCTSPQNQDHGWFRWNEGIHYYWNISGTQCTEDGSNGEWTREQTPISNTPMPDAVRTFLCTASLNSCRDSEIIIDAQLHKWGSETLGSEVTQLECLEMGRIALTLPHPGQNGLPRSRCSFQGGVDLFLSVSSHSPSPAPGCPLLGALTDDWQVLCKHRWSGVQS